MWRASAQQLTKYALLLYCAGLGGALLVRLAPGFGIDQDQWGSRFQSGATTQTVPQESIWSYYHGYLRGLWRGDLGQSESLRRPVRELLAERLPFTVQYAAMGLASAWLAALICVLPGMLRPRVFGEVLGAGLSALLLCVPSGVVALLFFVLDWRPALAIGVVLFPQVFTYLRSCFARLAALPHVTVARAKGLPPGAILVRHILPLALPSLLALAGISVAMAFSAAIPVEALCGLPGIGQLAWQAAQARDLPVLVNVTMVLTLFTLAANGIADWALSVWLREGQA